jgi:hypothetical protein
MAAGERSTRLYGVFLFLACLILPAGGLGFISGEARSARGWLCASLPRLMWRESRRTILSAHLMAVHACAGANLLQGKGGAFLDHVAVYGQGHAAQPGIFRLLARLNQDQSSSRGGKSPGGANQDGSRKRRIQVGHLCSPLMIVTRTRNRAMGLHEGSARHRCHVPRPI